MTVPHGALQDNLRNVCRGSAALIPVELLRMPEWFWRVTTIVDLWPNTVEALNCCFQDFLGPRFFVVLNAGLGVCDALVEGKGGSFMSVIVHFCSSQHCATRCNPMPSVLM